jgi:hypothetical protein
MIEVEIDESVCIANAYFKEDKKDFLWSQAGIIEMLSRQTIFSFNESIIAGKSDPESFQKLLKIFLRIYEIFQNSQKLLQLTQEFSGSGRIPNSLVKVRMSMIWLNTQDLVFEVLKILNTVGKHEKVQRIAPQILWRLHRICGEMIYRVFL